MKNAPTARWHRLAAWPVLAMALSLPAWAQPAPGAAAPAAAATPAQPYRALKASQLLGMKVQNREGQVVGKIDDLVVNMGNGDLRYAVLSFDAGVLSGERLFALPPDRLALNAEGNRVVVDVDREQFEKAAIARQRWSPDFLRDAAQVAVLDQAWSIPQPGRGFTAHRASDLLDADVLARNGEEIGDIEELVVDLGARKVHYAVVSFDPGWMSREKRYLFALSDFKLPRDPEDVQLDLDREGMKSLQGYDEARLKDLNADNWVTEVRRNLGSRPAGAPAAAPSSPNS